MSTFTVSLKRFFEKLSGFILGFSTKELVFSLILTAGITFIATISYTATCFPSPDVTLVHYGLPFPLLEKTISQKIVEIPMRYKIVPAVVIEEDLNFLFEGALLDFAFFFVVSFIIVRAACTIKDEIDYRKYCKLR